MLDRVLLCACAWSNTSVQTLLVCITALLSKNGTQLLKAMPLYALPRDRLPQAVV